MTRIEPKLGSIVTALVLIAGCTTDFSSGQDSSTADVTGESDAEADTPADEVDVPLDTGSDVPMDTLPDVVTDGSVDTSWDPPVDHPIDTIPDVPAEEATGLCDRNGFSDSTRQAQLNTGSNLFYQGQSSTSEPYDALMIELYYGYGDPPPLTGPGTFHLAQTLQEQNYQTCGTCVRILAGCSTVGGSCEKIFFNTDGVLEFTVFGPVGGRLQGTITGLTLIEVTISEATFESTPVPGGEGWCIESYTIDALITSV